MNYNLQLIVEATAVGISVIIMGTLVTYVFAKLSNKKTDFIWRPGMLFALFLVGFLLHVTYEFLGLNSYYCKMFNKTRK